MRTINHLKIFVIRIIFLSSLVVSISCSTLFFDHPQPTDSKNMNQVPKTIRGRWKNIRNNHEEILTIDKSSYHKVATERYSIPKSQIDGSKKYRLSEGKIYGTDQEPATGYQYELLNDTIFFSDRNVEEIVLSDSVLLRSAKNCYILNLKHSNWWEIILIKKAKNGEIRISYPICEDLMTKRTQYNIVVLDSTRKDSTYFHADFKSRNIDKVFPADDSGILYILKPDSTFDTPN
jgi:hypothetical protein